MAGLFHDLGLTDLPQDIADLPDWEVPEDKKAAFYAHVEASLNRVKAKRIIVPPAVEKAILQHHEKFNGRGGPKALSNTRISEEAMILSFADQFDYWTRLEEGKQQRSPIEAFEEIKRSGSISSELLAKIRRVLEKDKDEKGEGKTDETKKGS